MKPMTPKRRRSTARMADTRLLLQERCEGRCEHCGIPLPIADDGSWVFEIHHRKRRRDGGDGPENTLAVTPPCHTVHRRSIHQNPADSIDNGWIVRSHDDPALMPVLYMGREVVLGTDGSVSDAAA